MSYSDRCKLHFSHSSVQPKETKYYKVHWDCERYISVFIKIPFLTELLVLYFNTLHLYDKKKKSRFILVDVNKINNLCSSSHFLSLRLNGRRQKQTTAVRGVHSTVKSVAAGWVGGGEGRITRTFYYILMFKSFRKMLTD